MLDLWWINISRQPWVDSWCRSRRQWLDVVPDDSEALFSQLWRRAVLSRYTGQPAVELRFESGEKGKPVLAASTIHFNLSHSAGWHVMLVSDLPCGVDVENWQRPVDKLRRSGIMKRLVEADRLRCQDDAGLLRYWTMKEACTKQAGDSLWQHLSRPLVLSDAGWQAPGSLFSGHLDIGACVAWVAASASPIHVQAASRPALLPD